MFKKHRQTTFYYFFKYQPCLTSENIVIGRKYLDWYFDFEFLTDTM